MAYYQQPQPQPTQQQPQQNVAGSSYICCGNPFGDLFDTPTPTQNATPQKQQQTQDWNNPFQNSHSPSSNDERRHLEDASRADEDVRSIGTRRSTHSTGTRRSTYSTGTRRSTHSAVSSHADGKSLTDIEREEFAKKRALRLQESLVTHGDYHSNTHTSVLATDKAARKMARKQTQLRQPEVNAKSAAVNTAVLNMKKLKKDQKAVEMTETTRPKKEMTDEDVRDPETVPGMKSKVDIKKEEEAKTQTLQMISNGEYKFDPRAIIAFFTGSDRDVTVTRADKANVNELV